MAEKDPSQRIVITGMGTAAPTPNGFQVEGFWQDLLKGRHGIKDISSIIGDYDKEIETRLGAPLPEPDIEQMLALEGFDVRTPKKIRSEAKRWDKSAKAVVWAGAKALQQADLLEGDTLRVDPDRVNPRKFGVYMGTGIGGALNLIRVQQLLDGMKLERGLAHEEKEFKEKEYAYSMLWLLPGRVDEVPAILFNAKRVNDTVLTECAAGLASIDQAVDDIRLGRADVMLAGGVETAAHPAPIWAFETLGALNKTSNPNEAPRPFSQNPGGLLLGEGAGAVVLEPLDRVLHRQKMGSKVVILAEILGSGRSSDAEKETYPSEEGAGWAIDDALENAGVEADELQDGFVDAHATSTEGDIEEFRTVSRKFRKEQIQGISSIKGHTGHTFGAAGTLNTITGVLAIRDNILPHNRNLYIPHPETEGWPLLQSPKKVPRVGFVLVNAFGFGGKNRVVLLGPGEQRAT